MDIWITVDTTFYSFEWKCVKCMDNCGHNIDNAQCTGILIKTHGGEL